MNCVEVKYEQICAIPICHSLETLIPKCQKSLSLNMGLCTYEHNEKKFKQVFVEVLGDIKLYSNKQDKAYNRP